MRWHFVPVRVNSWFVFIDTSVAIHETTRTRTNILLPVFCELVDGHRLTKKQPRIHTKPHEHDLI